MFSKGVEFTFEFDPSDDEVRRTIRDSRCMLKCDACGDAAVVAAARALAAAYDAALAAEVRAGARARDAARGGGAGFGPCFCPPSGPPPAPPPLFLFVRPSRVRDRDRLFVVLAGATLVVTYRRDRDDAGPVAETCVEGYARRAGGCRTPACARAACSRSRGARPRSPPPRAQWSRASCPRACARGATIAPSGATCTIHWKRFIRGTAARSEERRVGK